MSRAVGEACVGITPRVATEGNCGRPARRTTGVTGSFDIRQPKTHDTSPYPTSRLRPRAPMAPLCPVHRVRVRQKTGETRRTPILDKLELMSDQVITGSPSEARPGSPRPPLDSKGREHSRLPHLISLISSPRSTSLMHRHTTFIWTWSDQQRVIHHTCLGRAENRGKIPERNNMLLRRRPEAPLPAQLLRFTL